MTEPLGLVSNVTPGTPGLTSETAVPPGYTDIGIGRDTSWIQERLLERGLVTLPRVGPDSPVEPNVDVETLNSKYGIPGYLKFSNPLPASVAQSMNEERRDEMLREARAEAAPGGVFPTVSRFGVNVINQLLDPIGALASAVPVVGEARIAGMFARAGLGEAAASFGGRFLAGAAAGAAGSVPLAGLQYGLQTNEPRDFTMMDAAADVLMGAVGFGALHAGVGHFFGHAIDVPELRQVAENPRLNEAMGDASIAQVMDGRSVEVAPILDAATGHWDAESGAAWERSVQQASNPTSDEAVAAIRQANEAAPLAKPLAAEHAPAPKPEDMAPLEAWARQMREPLTEGGTATPLTGILTASERAELDAIDQAATHAEGEAKAFQAAASCLVGSA